MTVQFRLGHTDHKVVEDFISSDPGATSAITLGPKATRQQQHVADVAREHGLAVFAELSTERLAAPGYNLDKFPLWAGEPYLVQGLAVDQRGREQLVDRSIEAQPGVSHLTAPHFYVDDERTGRLNVELAEVTRHHGDGTPVRAVVTISNRFAKSLTTSGDRTHAAELAAEYAHAGIAEVELRLSPFGGEDEGLAKIQAGFAAAQAFTDAGLVVTLGQSGTLGQAAVALGHAHAYSVGVGMLERTDHANQINRQKTPPTPRADGESGGGPTPGVYLNGLGLTVPARIAAAVLGHSDLRTRVGCRLGRCGTNVRGPLVDPREHYLHSRDAQMQSLLAQPPNWRPTAEMDRLGSALNLRRHLNAHYCGPDLPLDRPVKIRTLVSLISDIESLQQAS